MFGRTINRNYLPQQPSPLRRLLIPLLLVISALPLLLTYVLSHQFLSFYVPPSPYVPHPKRVSSTIIENKIFYKKNPITYERTLELFKEMDREFMEVFLSTLKSCTFESFYLEFVPINRDNLDVTPFSYALVDATDDLKDVEVNENAFGGRITSKEQMSTSFSNPESNSTIIAPTLKYISTPTFPDVYKTVASWIRESKLRLQSIYTFSHLAKVAELEIKEGGDFWISTSGAGKIGYVNFVVKSTPQNYHYSKYKTMEGSTSGSYLRGKYP